MKTGQHESDTLLWRIRGETKTN